MIWTPKQRPGARGVYYCQVDSLNHIPNESPLFSSVGNISASSSSVSNPTSSSKLSSTASATLAISSASSPPLSSSHSATPTTSTLSTAGKVGLGLGIPLTLTLVPLVLFLQERRRQVHAERAVDAVATAVGSVQKHTFQMGHGVGNVVELQGVQRVELRG